MAGYMQNNHPAAYRHRGTVFSPQGGGAASESGNGPTLYQPQQEGPQALRSTSQSQLRQRIGVKRPAIASECSGDNSNDDGEVADDQSNATGPSTPSFPPITSMDSVIGYEDVSYEGGSLIPPPAHVETAASNPEQASDIQPDMPTISEEDARIALFQDVSDHCCYGSGAAENLVITNIQSSSAFHYQLETFTEGRQTSWAYEPFDGQAIDGPENGQAPSAWNIAAHPDGMFYDHQKSYEVPHTASVKTCTNCGGEGVNRCWRCLGCGMVVCGSCNGNGCHLQVMQHYVTTDDGQDDSHSHVEVVPCLSCNCTGRVRCWTCGGCGLLECEVCDTHGQLKYFIKLTITWTTHKNDHIVERTALPDELIRGAEGQQAFMDQRHQVIPMMTFPDQAVNEASQRLIRSHSNSFRDEKILMQRHWIRIVPVSEVHCDHKGTRFSYWVYGHENRIFNPDYPQQCCWGCTVL